MDIVSVRLREWCMLGVFLLPAVAGMHSPRCNSRLACFVVVVAFFFFFNALPTAPPTVSTTNAQVTQGAIVCKSRATHQVLVTCNVSCVARGQPSYIV